MKLKNNFVTYTTENEHITVATGNSEFTGMLRSNETAGFIIELLKNDITQDEIVARVYNEYEAPVDTVRADVSRLIEKLRSVGAIEE